MDFPALWSRLVRALSSKYPSFDSPVIKDAVSESIYRLYSAPSLSLTVEQQYTYLLHTAQHLLFREYRRTQREPLIDESIALFAKFDPPSNDEWELIEFAVSKLTFEKQSVVRPKLFENTPLHIVAARLGKKTTTVQKTYTRAIQELRIIIEEEYKRGG